MAHTMEISQPERRYSRKVGRSNAENSSTNSEVLPPADSLTFPSLSSDSVQIALPKSFPLSTETRENLIFPSFFFACKSYANGIVCLLRTKSGDSMKSVGMETAGTNLFVPGTSLSISHL